jgi:outer membrane protein TolC
MKNMKTRIRTIALLLIFTSLNQGVIAQVVDVSPELKELILLSVSRDHKTTEKNIETEIALTQRNSVRLTYLPKLEVGGKYLYATTSLDSKIGDVTGLESLSKLQEFMNNPAFPALFPELAGLSGELISLQKLLIQQGIAVPTLSNDFAGDFSGSYYGLDASARMVLFSGGQIPNLSGALREKAEAQQALAEKCSSDVIAEVITCYDQLAVLNQSEKVLDESALRLDAEKKFAFSALTNGFATGFDTLKIAVAREYLNARIAEYQSKKTLLHHKLSQLTGKSPAEFEMLSPELKPAVYMSGNAAIDHRAEMRALSAGVQAQRYLLKAEKSHYLPKIQAMASLRYDRIAGADATFDAPLALGMDIHNMTFGPTFLAGVGFKWELFDRSGGTGKEKLARLELKKAENSLEEARELLQLNQVKADASYDASNAQLIWKKNQKTAAIKALELARKSYNEGMISITELLAAETEVQNAELEYLQAIFNQRQATLECYKATGSLTLNNLK